MGVGGGSTSRKTYTGTISSMAGYAQESRYIGIASSTSINGIITCEYSTSVSTDYPIARLNINGTDVALPSFSAGASKSCIVNIPCNEGDTIIFKIHNNISIPLSNVAWTLTL